MEYAKLEPFGEERADLRAAIVAATIANANRGRRRRPFEVKDFMPRFDSSRQRKTPAQLLQIVEMLNTALGGKDLRGQRE